MSRPMRPAARRVAASEPRHVSASRNLVRQKQGQLAESGPREALNGKESQRKQSEECHPEVELGVVERGTASTAGQSLAEPGGGKARHGKRGKSTTEAAPPDTPGAWKESCGSAQQSKRGKTWNHSPRRAEARPARLVEAGLSERIACMVRLGRPRKGRSSRGPTRPARQTRL